ncbi:insoluble matrix shell protein 6-like [Ruditapes philippinarum]|uniref:insoluble matrix shell protein 6-like n=1 Tax=Ruditapes philippinarum TaxID=129788 RepID=UPI00295BC54C|nr:insoluble matrix shell protein 6-like [Ruditapes philippinarum]
MKTVVILVLFAAVAHCAVRRDKPDFDCDKICRPFGYDPVCSDRNKQFDNECFLDCEWKYKGCDGRCPCNRPDTPDRPDRPNYIKAQRPQYRPEPRPEYRPQPRPEYRPQPRPEYRPQPRPEYRPQPEYKQPEPQPTYCVCERKYDPVCTTDGTEDNDCIAKCQGKYKLHDGQCY